MTQPYVGIAKANTIPFPDMFNRIYKIGWGRLKGMTDYDIDVEFVDESVVEFVPSLGMDIFKNYFANTSICKPNILVYKDDGGVVFSMLKELLQIHLDAIIKVHGKVLTASKFCELEIYPCNSDGHLHPLPDDEDHSLYYTGMKIRSEVKA